MVMFTGIVEEMGEISHMERASYGLYYGVTFSEAFLEGVQLGGSISIDGACQTVVAKEGPTVFFNAVFETLEKTTLGGAHVGIQVNGERPLRVGDELGGHLLTGHVLGRAQLRAQDAQKRFSFQTQASWIRYLFPKGYIALDGVSLTLGEVDQESGIFSVYLIPETLSRTTLGIKSVGSFVNVEVDFLTQAAVDTTIKILSQKPPLCDVKGHGNKDTHIGCEGTHLLSGQHSDRLH